MDGARSNVEVVDVGEQVTDRLTARGRGREVGDRLSCIPSTPRVLSVKVFDCTQPLF